MLKNKKGFTLIELLVVIAIIGLLSTLAIISLRSARVEARDAKRRADIATLQSALAVYHDRNDKYPLSTCIEIEAKFYCLSTQAAGDPYWIPSLQGYMTPPPEDPGGHSNTNWDQYIYFSTIDQSTYTLFFMLENGPQEDVCGAGLMNFFPPEAPRRWSTRCPD